MKFCSCCGQNVSQVIPEGDNRLRYVCDDCDTIHYTNPNNVCGAILTWGEKILLCQRAIEPRHGLWTLPAGFMENGETIAEAAARESMEEANAVAKKLDLFGIFCLPFISQVYVMFQGELKTAKLVIEEGAVFEGVCSMGQNDSNSSGIGGTSLLSGPSSKKEPIKQR